MLCVASAARRAAAETAAAPCWGATRGHSSAWDGCITDVADHRIAVNRRACAGLTTIVLFPRERRCDQASQHQCTRRWVAHAQHFLFPGQLGQLGRIHRLGPGRRQLDFELRCPSLVFLRTLFQRLCLLL